MKAGLFKFINRWRHTLGYGVHSPLAYRIVRECTHPDREYGYYADSIIRSDSDSMEMRVQLRLIVRLINTLHLHEAWLPECPKRAKRILLQAYPTVRFHFGPKWAGTADFIVVFTSVDAQIISSICAGNDNFTILIFNPQADSPCQIRNATLTLQSRDFSLYLRRPRMASVCYELI